MGAAAVLSPVFGSATRQARELLAQDAAIRVPLPLCRRIGVVQLAPRCGASTAAAQVVTVLARRRAGMVLAVDASPSPHGLLRAVGAGPVPGPMSGAGAGLAAAVRAGARTAAEARAGLGRAASGCYGLDLRAGGPVPAGVWSAAVGPVARFFDVVLTDWGLRDPARDLGPVLSSSHVVCLVVRAEDAAVEAAAALLRGLAGRPGTPPVVVALVATGRGTRPVRLARTLPAPVVPVPFARPGPAAGAPVPYDRPVGVPVRPGRAGVPLAAALMRGASRDR